jgi:hypothetical protein
MFFQSANYPSIISELDITTVPTIAWYYGRTAGYPRSSLLTLLHLTSLSKATEPRDKIFALFGLSLEGLEREKYPRLKPDYAKPVVDIYADVVRHLIQNPHAGHN